MEIEALRKIDLLEALRKFYKNKTGSTCVSAKYAFTVAEIISMLITFTNNGHKVAALDMGCGYSTVVMKYLENYFPTFVAHGVDTSSVWLKKLKDVICLDLCLSDDGIFLWEDFPNTIKYDFISFDIALTKHRINYLLPALEMLRSDGIMLFDDMHKSEYRRSMQKILRANYTFDSIDLKEKTKDEYGRWAWAISNIRRIGE